jgi:hypothetical protein
MALNLVSIEARALREGTDGDPLGEIGQRMPDPTREPERI